MKKKYCLDCGKELGKMAYYYKTLRCRSCAVKKLFENPKNHPRFKHGKSLEKQFCKICNKEIDWRTITKGKGMCPSCAMKRRIFTVEWRNNISKATKGKSNPNFKGGKPKCIDCGKELSQRKVKDYEPQRCQECHIKIMYHPKGEHHPLWIDGRSFEPYTSEFTKQLKESIRKRDNYTCHNCGMTEEEHLIVYGTNLHVHHIDYDKQNCGDDNLITTCLSCNVRANFNHDYWREFYTNKVKEINPCKK